MAEQVALEVVRKPWEEIRATDLHVPGYQPKHRAEDGIAQGIIDNFDPSALGVLLISERDGKYWVMEGQRRRAACLAVGYDKPLDCYVHRGLTFAQEARIWGMLNFNGPQHIVDRYKAMVDAKSPKIAVQIDSIVSHYGFAIDYHNSSTAISAVKVLEVLYLWGSLPTVLSVIRHTWEGDENRTLPNVLMALGAFDLCFREQYLETDLIEALRHQSPLKLQQDAVAKRRESRSESFIGRTLWGTVAIGNRRFYNAYITKVAGKGYSLPDFREPRIPNDQLVIARKILGKRPAKKV